MARYQKPSAERAKPDAPVAPAAARRQPKPQSIEDTMFFPRLRRHAKWMFVFLALAFALGFVGFGVGAGGVGVGDIFRGSGGSTGEAVSDARKKTEENPKSVQAWRDLAAAYQADGDDDGNVSALEQASALRPKDVDILNDLAAAYQLQAQSKAADAGRAQARNVFRFPVRPGGGFSVGGSPAVGADPIAEAGQAFGAAEIQKAQSASITASTNAVATLKKIVDLQPDDPNLRLDLARTASSTGDATTALAAYEKYLELAPDDAAVVLEYASTAQGAQKTDDALAAYKRFLRLAPQDSNAAFVKGQIKELEKAKKKAEAAQSDVQSG